MKGKTGNRKKNVEIALIESKINLMRGENIFKLKLINFDE